MARPRKAPGAMLEMAAPEILAKMKAPEKKPRKNKTLYTKFRAAADKAKPIAQETDDILFKVREVRYTPKWKVGELDDYKKMDVLPANGKCTCNSTPFTWVSKNNPSIGWYCSHVAHGGNGKFWLYAGDAVPKARRSRKQT